MARDIVKVKGRYNITLTKPIREEIPIQTGQYIEVYTEGNRIVLVPILKDPSERLAELIGNLDKEFIAEGAERVSAKEAEESLRRKLAAR
ncbi:MAG: AbrB/MazE/SpoVT family DNA-binding domain-containing protein [Candidatus Bathyarchaeia archaeon]